MHSGSDLRLQRIFLTFNKRIEQMQPNTTRSLLLVLGSTMVIGACSISGHYRGEGACRGFHMDQTSCERAAANAASIGKVRIGQSMTDVQAIMGAADRRDAVPGSE